MDHQTIIQTYIHAYNTFDVPTMASVFSEEMIFEHMDKEGVVMRLEGKEAFRQQAIAAMQYFTTRTQNITSYFAHDHVVEVTIDYHAVAALDLPNGMHTGDTIRLKGKSIFQFSGDKVVRLTDFS